MPVSLSGVEHSGWSKEPLLSRLVSQVRSQVQCHGLPEYTYFYSSVYYKSKDPSVNLQFRKSKAKKISKLIAD
jgi:hypothetical protein